MQCADDVLLGCTLETCMILTSHPNQLNLRNYLILKKDQYQHNAILYLHYLI